jgi:putative membrane protein
MHRLIRYRSTIALGAALALAGACGKNDAASDSAATSDSAAAATNSAAMPADSAAMGGAAAPGAMTSPNALAMIGLSNGAEIQTSQIAEQKATNGEVRDFAKQMIKDHQDMQKEADELATKANLTPTPPPQADQKRAAGDQMVQQLNSTAKGADFDRAYIEGQVQAHQQTLAELQQLQTSVDNADLKALIQKAIPKVQEHLDHAQKLQSGQK